jgi:hypothetical protein
VLFVADERAVRVFFLIELLLLGASQVAAVRFDLGVPSLRRGCSVANLLPGAPVGLPLPLASTRAEVRRPFN